MPSEILQNSSENKVDKISDDDDDYEKCCQKGNKRSPRTLNSQPSNFKMSGWPAILNLAFQSLGVVYGDIGTSPLYVYSSTFTEGIKNHDDVLGVLSIIFYTITLIPLLKYVFIVLHANDNGDGGTFALYSLICRYAKVGLIPNEQAEDREVSNYRLELPNSRLRMASNIKSRLEKSPFSKYFILFATMLGTSMVVGDGVLTPCISVLSAVGGIKEATPTMNQDKIVWISVVILICLFSVQRFGTDKVGYSFAPIICIWFALISVIGVYNFFKFDPMVIKAINPIYILHYFERNKKQAWISLGGTVLSITGTEALFADVGHFTVRSIQISMCSVTYPALILAYIGQTSFLRANALHVSDVFYKSIPGPIYWPTFVVTVLSSIIASQAMISGTFSIIQQSLSLGCFPRVKIVHTSSKYEGQVYIPEINFLLMLACVCVTIGFKSTIKIGNAYGIAVVFVMVLTSSFLVLIMIMIWKTNIFLVIAYVLVIGSLELLYLSSVLYKFDQGGYLPLAFAMILMGVMYVWNDVYRRKYHYELDHKISPSELDNSFCQVPGLAIFYSELVQGIPPIFKHYMENVPALHSVLVFVSIKSVHVSKVPVEERFLLSRVGGNRRGVFRCIVRYGYTDMRVTVDDTFEARMVENLKEFAVEECLMGNGNEDEVSLVESGWRSGVVHLVGESEVAASRGACFGKRVLIDYAYNFLKRNLRQADEVLDIPHRKMLKVGMTYEL